MGKKLKRRSFIGNISAAVIGTVTLGACANNEKDESERNAGKTIETSYVN